MGGTGSTIRTIGGESVVVVNEQKGFGAQILIGLVVAVIVVILVVGLRILKRKDIEEVGGGVA